MGKWSNVAKWVTKLADTSPKGYYTSGRHGFGKFKEFAKDVPYMRFRYTPSVVSRGWRAARSLNDYYRVGRDLHLSRAMESPWKLSMYVFKIIRRTAPWALSSGYFISRLVNWTPKQKKYFIYCIQQELRYGKVLSAKAFYSCVRKVEARNSNKKSLRYGNPFNYGRRRKSRRYSNRR